jgi:hypothetical protein
MTELGISEIFDTPIRTQLQALASQRVSTQYCTQLTHTHTNSITIPQEALISTTLSSRQPNLVPMEYEYHHGTGRHILMKPDDDPNRPKYSLKCCLCKTLDLAIFIGCIVFLYFAITYALSCLENSDN